MQSLKDISLSQLVCKTANVTVFAKSGNTSIISDKYIVTPMS